MGVATAACTATCAQVHQRLSHLWSVAQRSLAGHCAGQILKEVCARSLGETNGCHLAGLSGAPRHGPRPQKVGAHARVVQVDALQHHPPPLVGVAQLPLYRPLTCARGSVTEFCEACGEWNNVRGLAAPCQRVLAVTALPSQLASVPCVGRFAS